MLCQRGVSHSVVLPLISEGAAHTSVCMQPGSPLYMEAVSVASKRVDAVARRYSACSAAARHILIIIKVLRGGTLTGQHATGLSEMANVSISQC